MPEKLTTAPMSVRSFVSAAISRATSKSVSWIRIVTGAVIAITGFLFDAFSSREPVSTSLENALLAAGHRREKRDLAGAGNRSIRLDMGVVDRGADHPRCLKSVGVSFITLGEPSDQFAHGAHAGRRLNQLFGLADPFAHPGEIFHLHPSSSLVR